MPPRTPVKTRTTAAGNVISESTYTLDPNGNPTAITDQAGSTNNYSYDLNNRLSAVCYAAPCATATDYIRWTHDGDGNQRTETRPNGTTTSTYGAAGRIASRTGPTGTKAYTHDADGNLTSDGSTSFAWDAAGHLKSSTAGRAVTSFAYDGDGRRTSSTAGNAETQMVWDPTTGTLQLERDGTGKTLRTYAYGTGLASMTASGATYSFVNDPLGSVRAVLSATGSVQRTYTYEPYGAIKTSTSAGRKAPDNLRQFTGAYTTGTLTLMGARLYDAATSRFLSPDPAAAPGTGYTYGNANPMAYIDPLGLWGSD